MVEDSRLKISLFPPYRLDLKRLGLEPRDTFCSGSGWLSSLFLRASGLIMLILFFCPGLKIGGLPVSLYLDNLRSYSCSSGKSKFSFFSIFRI